MARTAAPGGVHQSAGSVASDVENVLTPAALGNTFSLTEKREGMTAAERQLVSRGEDVSVYFTTLHLLEVFRDAFEKAAVYGPSRALGYAHAWPRLFGPSTHLVHKCMIARASVRVCRTGLSCPQSLGTNRLPQTGRLFTGRRGW